jgi:SOUL heme-binding protein
VKHLFKALVFTTLVFSGSLVMAIEEPKYELVSQEGAFQIRRYHPVLIAETFVDGDMDDASNKGFRLIADFIFGNNTASNPTLGGSEKIAMTAPVTIEPLEIAPENMSTANRWRIHFVMPSSYNLASLPKPNNSKVVIREVPEATYAVLIYSGFNFLSNVQTRTDELMAWVKSKKMQTLQPPQLARYNPPWTLPMFRRNEIMVQIKSAS